MEDYLVIATHKDAPAPRVQERASIELAKEFAEEMVKQGWTCHLFIRHSQLTIEVASEKSAAQIKLEEDQARIVAEAIEGAKEKPVEPPELIVE